MPERYFLSCRILFILKTVNIVDNVNNTNSEKVAIIGPTVNIVNSARRYLENIVNTAKNFNSRPLYCNFFVYDKKSSTNALWFQVL